MKPSFNMSCRQESILEPVHSVNNFKFYFYFSSGGSWLCSRGSYKIYSNKTLINIKNAISASTERQRYFSATAYRKYHVDSWFSKTVGFYLVYEPVDTWISAHSFFIVYLSMRNPVCLCLFSKCQHVSKGHKGSRTRCSVDGFSLTQIPQCSTGCESSAFSYSILKIVLLAGFKKIWPSSFMSVRTLCWCRSCHRQLWRKTG